MRQSDKILGFNKLRFKKMHMHTHTHAHTHPLNGPFARDYLGEPVPER